MPYDTALRSARTLLDAAVMNLDGRPVGTVAACGEGHLTAENYQECFVRDVAVSAFVQLAEGKTELTRNFLETVLHTREPESRFDAHQIPPGIMPASFRVRAATDESEPTVIADFGNRAIGRVAPVDSMMWWMVVLHAYMQVTGDRSLVEREDFQRGIEQILQLCLHGSFEVLPTLLVPDASFMVDRRMGVYGHPLEIQALFYATLHTVDDLYDAERGKPDLSGRAARRQQSLREHVPGQYWLDGKRLQEMSRFETEEFGASSRNALNISPQAIPGWLTEWLPDRGGFFAGNLGPERMDFRVFAFGNLLTVLFGLASPEQAGSLMDLYERRWDDLVGTVPLKIAYPAVSGEAWRVLTGCDQKNVPWSYHNGGNWPALLWAFVAAAVTAGRPELAERALEQAHARLQGDDWPEYYDGPDGDQIGRRANRRQTWTAASFILAHQLLENPALLSMFPGQPDRRP